MLKPQGHTVRFPKEGGPPGEHGSVAFDGKAWKAFLKEISQDDRATVQAAMLRWCRFGPSHLPQERFKFMSRYEKGGASVRVDGFKGRQARFYGTTAQVDGKPMFLVTGVDPAKKQNTADPAILKAAGKAAFDITNPATTRKSK